MSYVACRSLDERAKRISSAGQACNHSHRTQFGGQRDAAYRQPAALLTWRSPLSLLAARLSSSGQKFRGPRAEREEASLGREGDVRGGLCKPALLVGTNMRVGSQDCPELLITERTTRMTDVSKSASSRMMFGLLPPSSWATRLTVAAAVRATSIPARVEPVNEC